MKRIILLDFFDISKIYHKLFFLLNKSEKEKNKYED